MLVRAHTADYAQQESLPLPLDFDELLSTVSEAFALQRGSVRIRSKHAPTDLWVVLASQSQLMDAVREASESAMHMLTIEVSGRSARRTLDALMFALDLARLGAQVAYLWWLSEEGLSLTLGPYTVSPAAALGVLLHLSVLANSIVALSVLVTELSENGALRRWFGGARGRIAPLLCSPLTLETLPLVASGEVPGRPCTPTTSRSTRTSWTSRPTTPHWMIPSRVAARSGASRPVSYTHLTLPTKA